MKFTRILSLLLALLTVALLLAACKPQEEVPETPEEPTVTTLNLITEGVTEYVIVRDYQASQAVISAVQSLVESITMNTGAVVTVKECFNDLEEETDVEAEKEILIGMTNRAASIEALGSLRSKDYTLSVHGSKLVIGGGGDDGTLTAITKFINDFVAEQGNRFAVKQGEMQSLVFTTENDINEVGSYSYTSAHILGMRIDSFGLIYPKNANNSEECKAFAQALSTHISTECGYELSVYKDTSRWCDYEIRIGDAEGNNDKHTPNDGCQCGTLGNDEYYIGLVKTQVTYEDGSTHDGARLYICFGKNAKDAALEAFTKTIMPTLQESTAFSLEEGFVLTNRVA